MDLDDLGRLAGLERLGDLGDLEEPEELNLREVDPAYVKVDGVFFWTPGFV